MRCRPSWSPSPAARRRVEVNGPPPHAERLAVALLRLRELGDAQAARGLVDGMSRSELRATLHAQTANVGVLLAAMFGEDIRESRLPGIARQFGRSPGEVTRVHLALLALRLAEAERP